MGFFETLYKGMIETGAKSIEEKYNKMPLDQLKKEWKDTPKKKGYRKSSPSFTEQRGKYHYGKQQSKGRRRK